MNTYFASVGDPFQKENLNLILRAIYLSTDRGFAFLLDNYDSLCKLGNKKKVDSKLRGIISKDEIEPLFIQKRIRWHSLFNKLSSRYPIDAGRLIAEEKPEFYFQHGRMKEYEKAEIMFVEHYNHELLDYWVNADMWDMFLRAS